MKQSLNSTVSPARVGMIAFLAGLFIGLVVLGWWLWPVNWTGGDIEHLNPATRLDYLRAAIDSYAINQDATVAASRYEALGPYNQTALYEIYTTAEMPYRQSIESFAAAVMASNVLSGQYLSTAPTAEKPAFLELLGKVPSWQFAAGLGAIALIILLITLITVIRRRASQRRAKPEGNVLTFDTPPDQGQEIDSQPGFDTTKAGSAIETEPFPAVKEADGEIPDWLQEMAFDDESPAIPGPAGVELSETELSDEDIAAISSDVDVFSQPERDMPSITEAPVEEIAEVPAGETMEETPAAVFTEAEEIETAVIADETPEQTYAKFSHDLEALPGFQVPAAQKLKSIGITAPLLILKQGATPAGRQSIARQTGLKEIEVLQWVNLSDLLRIKGLKPEDAQALGEIGVGSMKDLSRNDPLDIFEWLRAQVATTGSAYQVPALEQVQEWVIQAKKLPEIVT